MPCAEYESQGRRWDNAVAASFFSHLKATVIEGRSFWDERQLRRVVFEYIEIHYARERKHSSNGWKTLQNLKMNLRKVFIQLLSYLSIFWVGPVGNVGRDIETCWRCHREY